MGSPHPSGLYANKMTKGLEEAGNRAFEKLRRRAERAVGGSSAWLHRHGIIAPSRSGAEEILRAKPSGGQISGVKTAAARKPKKKQAPPPAAPPPESKSDSFKRFAKNTLAIAAGTGAGTGLGHLAEKGLRRFAAAHPEKKHPIVGALTKNKKLTILGALSGLAATGAFIGRELHMKARREAQHP